MVRQCKLLEINRSMLYYKPKVMSLCNQKIMDRIDEIYIESPEYGYRYIYHQLIEDGYKIGRDRTLKYMCLMGLEGLYPKKKKNTSLQNKCHKVYKYLLDPYWKTSNGNRSINVSRVNEVWSGEIQHILGLQVGFYIQSTCH